MPAITLDILASLDQQPAVWIVLGQLVEGRAVAIDLNYLADFLERKIESLLAQLVEKLAGLLRAAAGRLSS